MYASMMADASVARTLKMNSRFWLSLWLILHTHISPAVSFYLPGIAPIDYEKGDRLDVKAVKMTSIKTQLPFDYYAVPICKPENLQYKPENLGEVLRGDRIVNTLYDIKMAENKGCTILCAAKTLTAEESTKLTKLISDEYHVHMVIDNLPVATTFELEGKKQYDHGFKLGFGFDKDFYLNNHLKMTLKYHSYDKITFRVVGFEAETRSVARDAVGTKEGSNTCSFTSERPAGQVILPGKENSVLLTYEVKWEASEVVWASRWDTYLAMSDVQIHWFAIVNSVVIVLFLSGIVAMIMIRTLRRDIARYNKEEEMEETLEETGWKLVHGDVFRPPQRAWLLTAFVGSGVQIFCMVVITLVFAMLGMLSPASRGSLMTAMIFLYVFMGVFAGYFAARLYKTCKGLNWKKSAFLTATLYPGVISIDCFILNFFIWGQHSSGAVPFTTMLALMCLWLGISTPLVFLGYYFGYRKYPYEHPVRTNQIPRQVPEQPWFISPIPSNLLAGILPFGAVFIELFFILSAIWENQFYYLFGFLFLVFLILASCVSQISIVMIYFQLCAEDYHWWWRSFFMSGSCSIYVFFYAVFYFVTKLEIEDFVPGLLYFGYTCIMVLSFWLLTGTVGFYATYIFIRHIYAAVKID
ncbi:transmembrane 9 superfamily member 4-like isoform X1 [Acropora palmata]|uniref:transmembrane 9 superfamily member 4-like isoform X1 n=2 Tax=Acropora palmata TaxID=6131 RepID=UPI003DA08F61